MADAIPTPTPATTTPTIASPEMMVKVKIDRTEYTEPLSKVVASYQTQSAAEKRLADANALLVSRKAQIDFADRFLAQAKLDPGMAIEDVRRQLEQQLGRPIRMPSETRSADDGTGGGLAEAGREPDAQTRRLEAQLAQLAARMNQQEATTSAKEVQTELGRELDQYPTFRGTDEASKRMRGIAELAVAGLRMSNPNTPISDLVSELHGGLSGLVSTQANSERDKLANRQAELAGVPAASGTPGLTPQDAPPTMADVKSGAFKSRLEAWMRKTAAGR